MATNLQQAQAGGGGYEHFVSPKRKRMLSPHTDQKSNKDHGTHIPKHREVHDDDLICKESAACNKSPGTNHFLRQPLDRHQLKLNNLKKGNLFGNDNSKSADSNEDDFDADVDADDKLERRAVYKDEFSQKIELTKNFTKSRNFAETKSFPVDRSSRTGEPETDGGVESDFSGVAGRMSTLSVGKRRSSFGLPYGKRGSPGSSPSSQNSSVNSSLIMSPPHGFAGNHVLMADFHAADSPSQFPLRDQAGGSAAGGPAQNRRSKVNKLISSAIMNSGVGEGSPAGVASQDASGLSHRSANNTYIGPFHLRSSNKANHSDTDVMYSSNASCHSNGKQNSDSFQLHMSGGTGLDYSAQSDSGGKLQHTGSCGPNDGLFHHHSRRGGRDEEWSGAAGSVHSPSLPPRTPAVHNQAPLTHYQHNQLALPPYSASRAGRSLFPTLEEQEEDQHSSSAQSLSTGPPNNSRVGRAASDDDYQMGLAFEGSGSPLLTPTRPSRRLQPGSQAHSLSHSQTLSQQSHEAAMGDLGTPVTEVGSPAVLDDLDDLMDADDDSINSDGDGDHLAYPGDERHRALLGDSLIDEDGTDDPELARLAFPCAHSASQRKAPRGRRCMSPVPGTDEPQTAALKNRLFNDTCFTEDDHEYHLFAQRFVTSPVHGDWDPHGRILSPGFNYQYQQRRHPSTQEMSEPTEDTLLDSSADTTAMSTTGASSDILMLSKSTRSNSDNNSRNTSSCMDIHDGNNSFGSSNGARSNASIGTLPLPDQSAFDGTGNADLSRSSYENCSHGHIDPGHFGSPGSARKKRPAQSSHFPASPPSPTMGSPGECMPHKAACPPTPLHGLHWDNQDSLGSPQYGDRAHLKHARHQQGKHHRQGSRSSNAATETTPSPLKVPGAVGIAVPDSEESMASSGSSSSHSSDILSHNWHNNNFDLSSSESKAPFGRHSSNSADTFTSLSNRPALVRQSSLLDTKLLLSQSEDQQESQRPIIYHNDFDEVGLLGSGTFADVYKVQQRWGDQNVFYAVKKSKRQFRSKKDRELLMAEVRAMKLLGQQSACAYVVPFIRAWQEDSYFYVQMGYAERGTVKELLTHLAAPSRRGLSNSTISATVEAGGALVPDNTIWHVVHDVAAGLRHIHRCGMVHLDIKPANLLITEQGTIQIGDFGMAACIGSSDDGHEGDTR